MRLGVELELGNFNVSRSPFGLDFGTLDFGLGLDKSVWGGNELL